MKVKLSLIILFLTFSTTLFGQYNKVRVYVSDDFNPKASITVEQNQYDAISSGVALKNSLVMNGFKVISERTAKSQLELVNSVRQSDTTFNQNISASSSLTVKSIYVITFSYQTRANIGRCPSVMSQLSGQVVDLVNDGEIVATFSFSQGGTTGFCAIEIMDAVALKLKEQSK